MTINTSMTLSRSEEEIHIKMDSRGIDTEGSVEVLCEIDVGGFSSRKKKVIASKLSNSSILTKFDVGYIDKNGRKVMDQFEGYYSKILIELDYTEERKAVKKLKALIDGIDKAIYVASNTDSMSEDIVEAIKEDISSETDKGGT